MVGGRTGAEHREIAGWLWTWRRPMTCAAGTIGLVRRAAHRPSRHAPSPDACTRHRSEIDISWSEEELRQSIATCSRSASSASTDSRGTPGLAGMWRAGLGFARTGAREQGGDPDVRCEVFFTIFLGRPARLEHARLGPQRIDDAKRLSETELLAIAAALVLVRREQIPSLGEKRGGRMRRHGSW